MRLTHHLDGIFRRREVRRRLGGSQRLTARRVLASVDRRRIRVIACVDDEEEADLQVSISLRSSRSDQHGAIFPGCGRIEKSNCGWESAPISDYF